MASKVKDAVVWYQKKVGWLTFLAFHVAKKVCLKCRVLLGIL